MSILPVEPPIPLAQITFASFAVWGLMPSLTWAQTVPSSDLSITSVGLQQIDSASVDNVNNAAGTDIRFFFGERLRWTVGNGDGESTVKTRLLADARFTFDPKAGSLDAGVNPDANLGQNFETNNLRQLGVEFTKSSFTLDIGRHPVFRGGPRIVDGVQALLRPSDTLDVGFWGGLAPDVFETDFRIRPGFGPIVALTTSRVQLSAVGEIAFGEGELDRAAVLAFARVSSNRLLEGTARLDLELASADDGPRLSDFQIFTIFTPSPAVRFDALYNAFSSYQYLSTADADPEQLRFAQRLRQLDPNNPLLFLQDPTINHLVGGTARVRSQADTAAPSFELMARYRHNVDPTNRYARITPTFGLNRIGGRLDVFANINFLQVDAAGQVDAGVTAIFDVTDSAAVDASIRALSVPDYDGLGWYADLYVDVVSVPSDLIVLTGVSYLSEPNLGDQPDGGPALFVRVAKYLRPPKRGPVLVD